MEDKFDIIDYLSGLTAFVFNKSVLKRIALDRGAVSVSSYEELDDRIKDLMYADLLYAAYLSPNVMASFTHAHGSFSKTIGSQTVYTDEKERLYKIFVGIYKKYNDKKLDELESSSTMSWVESW